MSGNLGWKSLSNSKCFWQTWGRHRRPSVHLNTHISSSLLRRSCPGASWSSIVWRASLSTVAHGHSLHYSRPHSGDQSLPLQHTSASKAKISLRRAGKSQQGMLTDTATTPITDSQQSVGTPAAPHEACNSGTAPNIRNPAKWSDWGVHNYKAVVAYDGTNYRGFQLQKGTRKQVPTIQGVLEQALCQIRQESRETLRMQCSGRTDAGVHAKGQVINFYSNKLTPDCPTMMHSLSRMLPDSISVRSMQRVPPDFHARYTAQRKVYHYYLHLGSKVDPFTRWHRGKVLGPIDHAAMRQGAELLVGKHDFTHFASQGNPDPNPIKTIYRFDVLPDADGYVFQVEGSGFMYKMVRHMVGALLAVGAGNLQVDVIAQKLAMGSNELPGEKYRGWSLAEPQGLFLMNVTYPPHDDLTLLCHPDIRHDSAGRPLLGREAEQD